MTRLGHADFALKNGADGAPIWPDGLVGSITHTRGYCGVVVARGADVRAVGVDAESAADLKPGLESRICTAGERAFLERRPAGSRGRWGKFLFSAKEAVYKCQYPLTGRYLGFQEVELEIDPDHDRFRVRIGVLEGHRSLSVDALAGRYRIGDDRILSACVLERS